MEIEEAIDILENIIDDEVIGTYCVEIQKEGVNCSKNCEDKDCYLSEAIRTIVNYIDELQEENKELKKMRNLDNELLKNIVIIEKNYISKDKIRTKIKELEEETRQLVDEYGDIIENKTIRTLKELLGE